MPLKKPLIVAGFDFDGTLVDSLTANYKKSLAIIKEFGTKNLAPSLKDFCDARHPLENFYYQYGVPKKISVKKIIAAWLKYFKKYSVEVRLIPGAKEILEACREFKLKTVLISSNRAHQEIRYLLKKFGLFNLLDCVWTGAEDKKIAIEEAARYFKAEPEQVFYAGDTIKDVLSAKAAGAISIGYAGAGTYNFNSSKKILEANPDITVYSLEEILEVLYEFMLLGARV